MAEQEAAEYIDPNSGRASQPGGVAISHLGDQDGTPVDLGILDEPDDDEDEDVEDEPESDDDGEYPEDGTIPEVKDWVDDDLNRAQEAIDREHQRPNPRSTLLDYLESMLEG